MTLVPIIYTSLLIFSTFLLFVLTVSYLSYKAKSRSKLPRFVEPIQNHRLPFGVNALPINTSIVRPVVKPVQAPLPITVNNNFSIQKQFTQNKETSRIKIQKLNQREISKGLSEFDKNYSTNKRITEYPKNTRLIKRHRHEIMNQNINSNTIEERKNYKEDLPKQEHNLAEMNLLNYYSDNNEFEMVTLSASRMNRAI